MPPRRRRHHHHHQANSIVDHLALEQHQFPSPHLPPYTHKPHVLHKLSPRRSDTLPDTLPAHKVPSFFLPNQLRLHYLRCSIKTSSPRSLGSPRLVPMRVITRQVMTGLFQKEDILFLALCLMLMQKITWSYKLQGRPLGCHSSLYLWANLITMAQEMGVAEPWAMLPLAHRSEASILISRWSETSLRLLRLRSTRVPHHTFIFPLSHLRDLGTQIPRRH